jgi:hypothetical protein
MTTQSSPNSWDFTEALNLLHAFQLPRPLVITAYVPDFTLSPSSSSSNSPYGSPKRGGTLGNFDRVFRTLNRLTAIEALAPQGKSLDDGSSVSDDESTPPTTPIDCDGEGLDSVRNTKEVRWTDEVEEPQDDASRDTHKRKRSTQSPAFKKTLSSKSLTRLRVSDEPKAAVEAQKQPDSVGHLRHRRSKSRKSDLEAVSALTAFESEADDKGVDWWLKKSHYEITSRDAKVIASLAPISVHPSAKHQLPACVTPLKAKPKLWESPVCIEAGIITPLINLTGKTRLVRRLGEKLGFGLLQHFDLSKSLLQYGGNADDGGIHVFVDSSNIAIGFYDALKLARGLPFKAYTKRAPLPFHSLALIMERGRCVAKRVLVGSLSRGGELPDYMQEAARCGYEINSLNRVEKFKEDRSTGKRKRGGNGYGTSGQSSGSETPMTGTKKVTEQGVDEILHMKMLESIVDSKEPSTIVLATGDAAEAEYSGGFLKNVERALSKGWKVELVAWGHSMSYAYRSKDFLEKWADQFMIIDLDDFSEELLGVYIEPKYDSDV